MERLADQFRDPANIAVERALHKRDRVAYHRRWPRGECPWCTRLENALASSRFRERIKALVEQLG